MLYDCRSDSFNSDAFLWDVNTLSSMRLSLHRPHTDVRIVEGKSLQERLKALDLTASLRASVVSGLVEVAGAAAYLKHPTQSQLQDRVTLHYRTSTRLDMLSHRLLRGGDPLSMTSQNSATHVVVAVLYGAQAFLVFDDKNESSEGSLKLKDKVKKNFLSQSAGELLLSLEKANCFFELALYTDGEDFNRLEDFDTAVKRFRSLQKLLEPQDERAVPLKVWLYPLKKLVQTSPHVVGSIKVDILDNAVDVLEHLERNINICLDMMSIYSNLGVNSWYPHLKDALSEFSSLMRKYQSDFQKRLASCIKTIREKGEKGEQILQDLLKKNMQSPFSPQNMHNWLLNKDVQVVALNECRAANVTIVKSQDDLKRLIEDSQADRVLCFTLTSLEGEDPFLSALKQNMMNREETQAFRLPDISQKIHSHLHLFLSNKKTNEDAEHTKFIATSEPQPHFPEPSVCLYQFGNIVKLKVNLELKPDLPEKIITKQTSVAMRLQTFSVVHWYRMEYRTVSCRGGSRFYLKWSDIDVYNTGESVVIRGLTPETQYQLRYAVMDTNSMSDYSRITEFQTLPRARPGRPKVHKQNKDSLTVSWLRAEADEDSPVLHYMVEYMEAGLQGWQLILTEGPECECTVTLPYSTCYRVRVSAVYRGGDNSKPSEQSEVSLDGESHFIHSVIVSLCIDNFPFLLCNLSSKFCSVVHRPLRKKDLPLPRSAETPNREETSRAERLVR
uniref:Fibronectin type-III domain-containing protein n=1 Tax=Pygocentrus nattereri TaxID=42514 RepID=A0A3B4DCU8_PYGNA